jgi:hypothetical protein
MKLQISVRRMHGESDATQRGPRADRICPARRLLTYKQDLRDTYPFGMFAVPRNKLDNRLKGIAAEDRRCFFAQVRLLERVMLNS